MKSPIITTPRTEIDARNLEAFSKRTKLDLFVTEEKEQTLSQFIQGKLNEAKAEIEASYVFIEDTEYNKLIAIAEHAMKIGDGDDKQNFPIRYSTGQLKKVLDARKTNFPNTARTVNAIYESLPSVSTIASYMPTIATGPSGGTVFVTPSGRMINIARSVEAMSNNAADKASGAIEVTAAIATAVYNSLPTTSVERSNSTQLNDGQKKS